MVGLCDLRWKDPAFPCPKHGDKIHRCAFQEDSKASHTPFAPGAPPQHACNCGATISPDGRGQPPLPVRAILCPAPGGGFLDPVDRQAVGDVAEFLEARRART